MTVSVLMITYGHEKFIRQAIESILMQKCSFEFELIIANDNSLDRTDDVIKDLIANHQNDSRIQYYKHEANIGMVSNFMFALKKAKGKYIAMCEGDDYWIDEFKLEKQIFELENDPTLSICFHQTEIKYENGIQPFIENINKNTPEITTIYELLKGNYLHTASVVFKNYNDYPDWLEDAYPGDWALHVLNATRGNVKYINKYMAAYRVHYGGVHSTSKDRKVEYSLKTFENLYKEIYKRGFPEIGKYAEQEYNNAYATFYGLRNGEYKSFSRIEKSKLLLHKGSKSLKALFWVPLIFNGQSFRIYDNLLKLNKFLKKRH
jgi:glycosyltransferase involved in cell wall biosynthesis